MFIIFILLSIIKLCYSQCHPVCTYQCDSPKTYFKCNGKYSNDTYCVQQCDSPICIAVCEPVCKPINLHIEYSTKSMPD